MELLKFLNASYPVHDTSETGCRLVDVGQLDSTAIRGIHVYLRNTFDLF